MLRFSYLYSFIKEQYTQPKSEPYSQPKIKIQHPNLNPYINRTLVILYTKTHTRNSSPLYLSLSLSLTTHCHHPLISHHHNQNAHTHYTKKHTRLISQRHRHQRTTPPPDIFEPTTEAPPSSRHKALPLTHQKVAAALAFCWRLLKVWVAAAVGFFLRCLARSNHNLWNPPPTRSIKVFWAVN